MQPRAVNPIEGLPTIEVINLIEVSSAYRLDATRRYKAIFVIEDYLATDAEPTVRGVLTALLAHKEFEGFVSVAAESMLPGVTGWQSGQIT